MMNIQRIIKTLLISSLSFTTPVLANAADNCLGFDVAGQEYPAVRDRLIAEGWVPKYLSPPFEGAPFAEWVIIGNYAEVELCAPTGRTNCKFTFTSGSNTGAELSILTEGELIGVVTGHQCSGDNASVPKAVREKPEQQPIEINSVSEEQSEHDERR